MKYLIVGLGNPGGQYTDTRHNIGFKTLDALAEASSVVFTLDHLAHISRLKYKGRILVLVKPTTFMNLSGKSVNYWLQKEKIPVDNLLVITDDLSLPIGKLRLKPKGSDGGHNGLKDIQTTLNTNAYPRLRFGIGSDFARGGQVDYVLGNWTKNESLVLPERIQLAMDTIKSFCAIGLDRTMNSFNNK